MVEARRPARDDGGTEPGPGLDESLIREISGLRAEPEWMLDIRLAARLRFEQAPMPAWIVDAPEIDLDDICASIEPLDDRVWIRAGLPERSAADTDRATVAGPVAGTDAGRESGMALAPAGVMAGHEAEEAFHRNRRALARRGVVFTDLGTALRQEPELIEPHFARIASLEDRFAALNTAVWSGGWFIHVPAGVEIDVPLQAYSRINAATVDRFERTLIVAEAGSRVHYIDGCSAPVYSAEPLHSAVVEIVVEPGADVTHTTIQNWSDNVVNPVTKAATVQAGGRLALIDGNIGSRLTVAHPAIRLVGPGAAGTVYAVAIAGRGQHHDIGADVAHLTGDTNSSVISKSISTDGGRITGRHRVRVVDDAPGCRSQVRSDALILDEGPVTVEPGADDWVSHGEPSIEVGTSDARIDHGATASAIDPGQLFYLMSRGLSREQAVALVVNGFIEPVTGKLPMEYAVEWSRLIELQLEGAVG